MIMLLQDKYRIGLIIFENSMSVQFLNYILWDCLIIVSIIIHQSVLISKGLYNVREEEIEPIVGGENSAQYRLNSNPNIVSMIKITELKENEKLSLCSKFVRWCLKFKYMKKLFPTLKNEKPGIDLYNYSIAIQLVLCIYILLFCTRMTADVSDISQTIEYFYLLVLTHSPMKWSLYCSYKYSLLLLTEYCF